MGVETRRPQVIVCYDLMEGLTYEEEDMNFEIEPKLFLIVTITLSKETILLLSVGMPKIKSIKESDLKQRKSNQTTTELEPSTVKSKDFCVRPEVSLEEKVYPKTYYHHGQDDINWMKHQQKYRYKIFK